MIGVRRDAGRELELGGAVLISSPAPAVLSCARSRHGPHEPLSLARAHQQPCTLPVHSQAPSAAHKKRYKCILMAIRGS